MYDGRVVLRHWSAALKVAMRISPRSKLHHYGFSLAELMAVVTIVGILATLAIVGMRKYVSSSRVTEAAGVIQAIRAAQESHRAESQQYLDVSAGNLGSLYPQGPDDHQRPFFRAVADGTPLDTQWRVLSPVVKRQVRFGYACVAGLPGAVVPDLSGASKPAWGTPIEPWFVIQAVSDFNGLGNRGYVAASSFSPELYSEPE